MKIKLNEIGNKPLSSPYYIRLTKDVYTPMPEGGNRIESNVATNKWIGFDSLEEAYLAQRYLYLFHQISVKLYEWQDNPYDWTNPRKGCYKEIYVTVSTGKKRTEIRERVNELLKNIA